MNYPYVMDYNDLASWLPQTRNPSFLKAINRF